MEDNLSLNVKNHPVLIHCKRGKVIVQIQLLLHRTGSLVGGFSKNISFSDIRDFCLSSDLCIYPGIATRPYHKCRHCGYLSDGLASSESDVYAFGVVLFEIISGKEAIIRTEGTTMKNTERRSLASIFCTVLKLKNGNLQ
ncbi:hypothetical protein REPUB_Repub11eG0017500 [Reevesia pubescens]